MEEQFTKLYGGDAFDILMTWHVVEGPYPLAEEEVVKFNLPKPAGEGWTPDWWRVRKPPGEAWRLGWRRYRDLDTLPNVDVLAETYAELERRDVTEDVNRIIGWNE